MKARGEPVRVNDVIAYVITGDGQDYNKNVAERAYSPQDVSKSDSDLKIGNIFRRKYG
jgi:DNA polymerase alpha subunit A